MRREEIVPVNRRGVVPAATQLMLQRCSTGQAVRATAPLVDAYPDCGKLRGSSDWVFHQLCHFSAGQMNSRACIESELELPAGPSYILKSISCTEVGYMISIGLALGPPSTPLPRGGAHRGHLSINQERALSSHSLSFSLSFSLALSLFPSATIRTDVSLEQQRRNILRVRILEAP